MKVAGVDDLRLGRDGRYSCLTEGTSSSQVGGTARGKNLQGAKTMPGRCNDRAAAVEDDKGLSGSLRKGAGGGGS